MIIQHFIFKEKRQLLLTCFLIFLTLFVLTACSAPPAAEQVGGAESIDSVAVASESTEQVTESAVESSELVESVAEVLTDTQTSPVLVPAPPETYLAAPEPALTEVPSPAPTVTLSITGLENQVILPAQSVEMAESDTVYTVLKRAAQEQGVTLDYKGRGQSIYISGIDNLYEFDEGPESGWIYLVNGVMITKSCSASQVNAGDQIEWKYTLNLGRDQGQTIP